MLTNVDIGAGYLENFVCQISYENLRKHEISQKNHSYILSIAFEIVKYKNYIHGGYYYGWCLSEADLFISFVGEMDKPYGTQKRFLSNVEKYPGFTIYPPCL